MPQPNKTFFPKQYEGGLSARDGALIHPTRLILGGRYGSIEPKSGKSYIELEYEYATKNKKPLFAAVISDAYLEAKVKADELSAIETSHETLLKAFRETVTKKIC